MKIEATQAALAQMVKWASPFTDKAQFSDQQEHLACLLIEADESTSTLTVTAENDISAISFTVREDVKVAAGGRVLVKAAWLRTTLSVIRPDQVVTVATTDAGKRLRVSTARSEVSLALAPLTEHSMVPWVGATGKTKVVMRAGDFVDGYALGSISHDLDRRAMALTGVHFAATASGARFMSTNRQCSTYSQRPIENGQGEDDFALLLAPAGMRTALDYLALGELVEVAAGGGMGEDAPAAPLCHLLVRDSDGEMMFHLRVPTIDYPVSKYPGAQLLEMIEASAARATSTFRVEREELLRLMGNAEKMGALSPEESGGQNKYIQVSLNRREISVGVPGNAAYDESADLKSYTGAPVTFVIKWGLHGQVMSNYPVGDDMVGMLIEREGESVPVMVMLYDASSTWEPASGGLPQDYLGLFPIGQGSYHD